MLVQLIPNITIFAFSCAIILKARKMRKELNEVLGKEKSKEDFQHQINLIGTMLIVYLAFILTTGPVGVVLIIWPVDHANEKVFAMVLSWSSAFINPVIYCLKNKEFKEAYISLFRSMICLPQISKVQNQNN